MSKRRVHELAKQLGLDSKDLITTLQAMNIEVKNHMSSLSEDDEKRIIGRYKNKTSNTNKGNNQSQNRSDNNRSGGSTQKASNNRTGQGNRDNQDRNSGQNNRNNNQDSRNNNQGNRSNYQGNRSNQGNRSDQANRNSQGNRSNQANRNSQANRSNQGNSNTQSNRNDQGSRSNQGNRTGYQGNRNSGTQGNRNTQDNRNSQGNRNNQGNRTGYQGNRNSSQDGRSQNQGNRNNTSNSNSGQGRSNSQARTNTQGNRSSQSTTSGDKPQANRTDRRNQTKKNYQNNRSNNNNNNKNKRADYKPRNLEKKEKQKYKKKQVEEVVEEKSEVITIGSEIAVKALAEMVEQPISELVKNLMMRGIMATANQEINFELASELAMEYDYLVEKADDEDFIEEFFKTEPDDEKDLKKRPPVVVVMGHVDHGKTSLLDAIREARVTEGEHGGITQHIGAYSVQINDEPITFLDTPGHEAFTAMRLRGAMATDIAILVVAADDGVMPQTIEAINHAKAAGVQIIVAINKIDKEGANPDRVKQELIEYELVPEDWGGDTICVPVSAIQKTGIDELLEMIILVSEMEDLKANPKREARGIIVEAQLDKGRGPVATVLVQNGTLKVGDAVLAGNTHGKVRAMLNDAGKRVRTAGPSTPVEILGLNEVPAAGEAFYVTEGDREARLMSEKLKSSQREKMIQNTPQKVSLDDLFHQIHEGEMKELKLIVKADVQGSVEAVKQSLMKLSNEEVVINIIHGGVGAINESDVMLASASNAIIIGFNVRPESTAKSAAEQEKIDVRLYRVIYNAIEDIELAMKGMLDPIFQEKVIGHAEVRDTFTVSNVGTIAGSYVTDGKMNRNASARLVRNGIVLYEGELASLKRFKDDVKEVATGYECGIMLEKYNDLKIGDVIEAFIMEEIPR